MYDGDLTVVKLGDKRERVNVTSGIRQGCSALTFLLKLITFKIIRKLSQMGEIIQVEERINLMWLANDTTLLVNSVDTASKNIKLASYQR